MKHGLVFAFAFIFLLLPLLAYAECGDGTCGAEENQCTCAADCGACSGAVPDVKCKTYQCISNDCKKVTVANCCGNLICESGEGYGNCPADCEPTSLEMTLMAPAEGGSYFRGEMMHIKVQINANGRSIPSAKISAEGPFKGPEFYNDGEHGDVLIGDNIQGGYAQISDIAAEGPNKVKVSAYFRQVSATAEVTINIRNDLTAEHSINDIYILGDTMLITGRAMRGSAPAAMPVDINITYASETIFSAHSPMSGDGRFSASYRTSQIDRPGEWLIKITGTDEYGNVLDFEKMVKVFEPAQGAFLTIEIMEPLEDKYERGKSMEFKVLVKGSGGGPVTDAEVRVESAGRSAALEHTENGVYEGPFKVGMSTPLGMQNFIIIAEKDQNTFGYEGRLTVRAEIEGTGFDVEIEEMQKQFSIGDTVRVVASAKYPGGGAVTDANAVIEVRGRTFMMQPFETGKYAGDYTFTPEDEGRAEIKVLMNDGHGNRSEAGIVVDVSGFAITFLLMQNIPYILIALAVIITVTQLGKIFIGWRGRTGGLEKERIRINNMRRETEDRYFNKINMPRGEFEEKMEKYDAELARINREAKGGKK
ncbi:MAG: hypothetical protein ABH854_01530 [Candidatus Diapherotrites archaeon]